VTGLAPTKEVFDQVSIEPVAIRVVVDGTGRMSMDQLARQSAFLLDLYRGASQLPADGFQDWALERLCRDLPFDSAAWATGAATETGPSFHRFHLWRQPPQMLIDYERIKHLDTMFIESSRQIGKTIRATARTSLPDTFMPYIDRYGLEQGLGTLQVDPDTALMTGFSLYRSDRGRPFTAEEADFKQCVFPHLIEADTRNKLVQLENSVQPRVVRQWRSAAVSSTAQLRYADDGFKQLVLREWPHWRGPYLPEPLHKLMTSGLRTGVVGRDSVARFATLGDTTLIQLRERAPIDELPERVRQVAQLAARGQTHKSIARALSVAPSTVRNQLATAYQRLGVNNKAEMAALVLLAE
jgi:DNA-binding CsgD family transcriptional regulator